MCKIIIFIKSQLRILNILNQIRLSENTMYVSWYAEKGMCDLNGDNWNDCIYIKKNKL